MKSTLHFLFLLLAVFCTGEMIGGRKNGKRKRTNAADIAEVRRTLVDLIKKKDLTNLQVYLEKFPEKHASSLTAAFCEEGESQFDSVFGSLNAALGTWLYHDPDFSTLDNKISHLLRFMKKKGADLSPIALMHLLILYDRMGKKEIEIEFVVRKVWDTWDYEKRKKFLLHGWRNSSPLHFFAKRASFFKTARFLWKEAEKRGLSSEVAVKKNERGRFPFQAFLSRKFLTHESECEGCLLKDADDTGEDSDDENNEQFAHQAYFFDAACLMCAQLNILLQSKEDLSFSLPNLTYLDNLLSEDEFIPSEMGRREAIILLPFFVSLIFCSDRYLQQVCNSLIFRKVRRVIAGDVGVSANPHTLSAVFHEAMELMEFFSQNTLNLEHFNLLSPERQLIARERIKRFGETKLIQAWEEEINRRNYSFPGKPFFDFLLWRRFEQNKKDEVLTPVEANELIHDVVGGDSWQERIACWCRRGSHNRFYDACAALYRTMPEGSYEMGSVVQSAFVLRTAYQAVGEDISKKILSFM